MQGSKCGNALLVTALLVACVTSAQLSGQGLRDPHRPACTGPRCERIRTYLKAHYCGQSPYGDGPDNGCEIQPPKEPGPGIKISVDFSCDWNDAASGPKCRQNGLPSQEVRSVLIGEMRRAGLPPGAEEEVHFRVWEVASIGWVVAEANYEQVVGNDLKLCDVIVLIDRGGKTNVVRKVPFQKTDAVKPLLTEWSLFDIVDADHDGQFEIILEGDAYEDHWLEVVGLQDGSFKTLYSGLGYYL